MIFLVLPGRAERTEAPDMGLVSDPRAPAENGRSGVVWLSGVPARVLGSAAHISIFTTLWSLLYLPLIGRNRLKCTVKASASIWLGCV